jgi:hypothetical protein
LTPGKNLEVFIKEILKGKNSREINKVIEMWKKSDYGSGTAFYDLITDPYPLWDSSKGTGQKFHEWLKEKDVKKGIGLDNVGNNFAEWLLSAEEVGDIIGPICEYKIW